MFNTILSLFIFLFMAYHIHQMEFSNDESLYLNFFQFFENQHFPLPILYYWWIMSRICLWLFESYYYQYLHSKIKILNQNETTLYCEVCFLILHFFNFIASFFFLVELDSYGIIFIPDSVWIISWCLMMNDLFILATFFGIGFCSAIFWKSSFENLTTKCHGA